LFDAFSSREPVSTSLESAPAQNKALSPKVNADLTLQIDAAKWTF